jgi:hypothetical protein
MKPASIDIARSLLLALQSETKKARAMPEGDDKKKAIKRLEYAAKLLGATGKGKFYA